jgi:hypothetical protein
LTRILTAPPPDSKPAIEFGVHGGGVFGGGEDDDGSSVIIGGTAPEEAMITR